MAFSFCRWINDAYAKMQSAGELEKQVNLFLSEHPNVIFGTVGGSGLEGMNAVSISVHRDFADYSEWADAVRRVFGKHVAKFDSYLISLKSDSIVRHMTFKHFPEYLQQTKDKPE